MRKLIIISLFLFSVLFCVSCLKNKKNVNNKQELVLISKSPLTYRLPTPNFIGNISVEEALNNRRTHRTFVNKKISIQDISQILWAAYGITKFVPDEPNIPGGYRTSPSAGSVYPLQLYLLASKVNDIEKGVYKYYPENHTIIRVIDNDIKKELTIAALNQEMISDAPACIFISAIPDIMFERYSERGITRYIYMEAGHSAQNIYLQVEALHLGTCSIGAFKDDEVKKLMKLSNNEAPLYIMPIGKYYKDN